MDTRLINSAAQASLDGSLAFPEVVRQLIEAGVEYYQVDYVALKSSFYSADGGIATTAIPYENLPSVARDFDVAALRANILDSQQKGQSYRDFAKRAMSAGVQGYITFLRGQRVIYWGRNGDSHTEWFPGAKKT